MYFLKNYSQLTPLSRVSVLPYIFPFLLSGVRRRDTILPTTHDPASQKDDSFACESSVVPFIRPDKSSQRRTAADAATPARQGENFHRRAIGSARRSPLCVYVGRNDISFRAQASLSGG